MNNREIRVQFINKLNEVYEIMCPLVRPDLYGDFKFLSKFDTFCLVEQKEVLARLDELLDDQINFSLRRIPFDAVLTISSNINEVIRTAKSQLYNPPFIIFLAKYVTQAHLILLLSFKYGLNFREIALIEMTQIENGTFLPNTIVKEKSLGVLESTLRQVILQWESYKKHDEHSEKLFGGVDVYYRISPELEFRQFQCTSAFLYLSSLGVFLYSKSPRTISLSATAKSRNRLIDSKEYMD